MLKLYSQPTCGMCKAIHLQLEKEGIPYEEIQDVDVIMARGIRHTPTIETEKGILLQGGDIIKFIKEYNRK